MGLGGGRPSGCAARGIFAHLSVSLGPVLGVPLRPRRFMGMATFCYAGYIAVALFASAEAARLSPRCFRLDRGVRRELHREI